MSNSFVIRPCKFGSNCTRINDSEHCQQYSHDHSGLRPCKWGSSCKKFNDVEHCQQFSHAKESNPNSSVINPINPINPIKHIHIDDSNSNPNQSQTVDFLEKKVTDIEKKNFLLEQRVNTLEASMKILLSNTETRTKQNQLPLFKNKCHLNQLNRNIHQHMGILFILIQSKKDLHKQNQIIKLIHPITLDGKDSYLK